MSIQSCMNFIDSQAFPDVTYWLYESAIVIAKKGSCVLEILYSDLNMCKNTLQLQNFNVFLASPRCNNIKTTLSNQKSEIQGIFETLISKIFQKCGRKSNYEKNLQSPLGLASINKDLTNYMTNIMKTNLNYNITNNPQLKRRFFYNCASIYKSLYVDMEFPYFLEYKKKKFNWGGFMNNFATAQTQEYINIVKIH